MCDCKDDDELSCARIMAMMYSDKDYDEGDACPCPCHTHGGFSVWEINDLKYSSLDAIFNDIDNNE